MLWHLECMVLGLLPGYYEQTSLLSEQQQLVALPLSEIASTIRTPNNLNPLRLELIEQVTKPLNFSELGISPDILQALASKGIDSPFPIQEQAIPIALTGQDLIGQAKTGTGKTLGFGQIGRAHV